jgi:hypothetical protein
VANPSNPVFAIWHGVWTPSSYVPHTTTFTSASSGRGNQSSSILVIYDFDPENGVPLYIGLYVDSNRFNVQIPIIPAPTAAAALAPLMLPLLRRRRR